MHGRHDSVRDILLEAARSAGCRRQKEVIVDSSGLRPADVYFPEWSRGMPLAVDVTISNPSQATTTHSATGGESASVRAALGKTAEKERKYQAQCASKGVEFLALVVCCYGGWLPEPEELVKEVALRVAYKSGISPALAIGQLWQRLSIAVWKGNARQVLRYFG